MVTQQRATQSGMRTGLMVGVALAVLALVLTALYDLGVVPGFVQAVEFVVALVGFGAAGFLASRQTGRAKSGVGAGLIAGICPGVVIQGISVVVAVVSPATFARWFGYHDVSTIQLLMAAIVQAVIGVVLWAVIGTLLGGLGGLIGRGRVQVQPAL